MNWFQIKSYLKYLLKARYKKGYGLHSPFVFNLVREVFYCEHKYYAFDEVKDYCEKLKHSDIIIEPVDYGAGSVNFRKNTRKVSAMVSKSSISNKYGELLFRILVQENPKTILELGTSVGVSSLYFSLSDKRRNVYTIEGCANTAQVAKTTFEEMGCTNVNQIVGQFQDVLPDLCTQLKQLDFVFFDGHHDKVATLNYFNNCLPYAANDSVFVFDDIHWSKGMEEAWEIISSHPKVTVSIDLFQLGIVFFKKECQKQHFVVRY
ncbi:class I SAM-dependent methyltransferase [Carboxylicivirga sp. A043]|uniref:O-methyltransferase n=1 Tax=Carboxylicivirga litoralis TaxID=2816963 RepID=UPI0021CAF32B|nr:class I SAM-dependent methyltransferase [Carboxylicivirga sp. A043]MCU4156311.1 class I SAM-dependent methyltransferase [Carboxylicivirga sp. A043]